MFRYSYDGFLFPISLGDIFLDGAKGEDCAE